MNPLKLIPETARRIVYLVSIIVGVIGTTLIAEGVAGPARVVVLILIGVAALFSGSQALSNIQPNDADARHAIDEV